MPKESLKYSSPLGHALALLNTSLDHLEKVVEERGADGFSNAELIGWRRFYAEIWDKMSLIDHQFINDAEASGLPAAYNQPSMQRFLMQVLGLSRREACQRVLAAKAYARRPATAVPAAFGGRAA
jgi:hypothetical protein